MKTKLEDLTDVQFENRVEQITREAERRGIIIRGTAPVYPKNLGGPVLTALMKIQRRMWQLNCSAVHKTRDLNLTDSEKSNLSTLRQAGLIAQAVINGKEQRGYWLITRRGSQFLRGELRMPQRVHTMANHPIKHQPPEPMLFIHEFKRKKLYQAQQYEEFVSTMNLHVAQPKNSAQMSLLQLT